MHLKPADADGADPLAIRIPDTSPGSFARRAAGRGGARRPVAEVRRRLEQLEERSGALRARLEQASAVLADLHSRDLELLRLRQRALRLSAAARARQQAAEWWFYFNRP